LFCRLAPRRKLIMCRSAECLRRRSPALIPCCHQTLRKANYISIQTKTYRHSSTHPCIHSGGM
jgi:hypothetical protein